MRITYVYDGTYPSSQADAWQVLNTACALSREGARVKLVCSRDKDAQALTLDGLLGHYGITGDIELVEVPSLGLGGRSLVKLSHPAQAVWRDLKKSTDLFYTRNIPALVAANLFDRPVVYDTYRPWPSQYRLMKLFFRNLFRREQMLGAFFHSEHTMKSFISAGIAEGKLRVAHNGYNASFFDTPMSTREAREALGMDPDAFVIGYTGRLDGEKGMDALLDIVEREPAFQCLLVGGGDDVQVMARIESLPNVTLFPWQTPSTLAKFLYACDCLMIPPSTTPLEAGNTVLPMKLFAYFASGRAIVAPRSPDTDELLHHGENSWLLQAGDIEDCIGQLKFLRDNASERERLGAAARKESEGMTWDHRARRVLTQIEQWQR